VGTTHRFVCETCRHAFDSSDGEDRGFLSHVRSMTCADCEDVVDVVTGMTPAVPEEIEVELRRRIGKCPRCDGANVAVWDSSKPCPKCGGRVAVNPEGPTTLWD
jgi:Zn finger protein HypA/HybF involved in hydrogenase expression